MTKTFAGGWSTVRCTFVAALDEIPSNGGVDIATVSSAGPTSDDVGLRVYYSNFELISCRNGSDCLSQVNAGGLPPFGEFHRYRLEWTAAAGYSFALDDQPRGTIATKTPLVSPANATVAFGTIYRPYGTGGAFRIRHDDVACVRTP